MHVRNISIGYFVSSETIARVSISFDHKCNVLLKVTYWHGGVEISADIDLNAQDEVGAQS